jgi:putative acetyltransferase
MLSRLTVIEVASNTEIEMARSLLSAYAVSLPFSLDYQGFTDELEGLPGPYAPPQGCLLLALAAGSAVGVVGLKPLAGEIAEIKRLYVIPTARGQHVGQTLVERVLQEAAAKGYRRVRLDTHRATMPQAIALYRRLGFVEIAPYGPNPDGAFAFFEKRQDPATTAGASPT